MDRQKTSPNETLKEKGQHIRNSLLSAHLAPRSVLYLSIYLSIYVCIHRIDDELLTLRASADLVSPSFSRCFKTDAKISFFDMTRLGVRARVSNYLMNLRYESSHFRCVLCAPRRPAASRQSSNDVLVPLPVEPPGRTRSNISAEKKNGAWGAFEPKKRKGTRISLRSESVSVLWRRGEARRGAEWIHEGIDDHDENDGGEVGKAEAPARRSNARQEVSPLSHSSHSSQNTGLAAPGLGEGF